MKVSSLIRDKKLKVQFLVIRSFYTFSLIGNYLVIFLSGCPFDIAPSIGKDSVSLFLKNLVVFILAVSS